MSDDWGTPIWLMDLFEEWYDPCPLGGSENGHVPDGLEGEIWYANRIYINPPYSNPKPWVEKAIRTHQADPVFPAQIVMLLKHDSSTQWYRMLKEAGARFLMIEGRLRFRGSKNGPASFPSVLAVLS